MCKVYLRLHFTLGLNSFLPKTKMTTPFYFCIRHAMVGRLRHRCLLFRFQILAKYFILYFSFLYAPFGAFMLIMYDKALLKLKSRAES